MSRFNSSGAKHFRIHKLGIFSGQDNYKISWTMDFYYKGSTLRYPRSFSRITDLAGAKRFCKKHKLELPK